LDITVEGGWQRLVAGGWVSLVLVAVAVVLVAALVNRQRQLRQLRRRFQGGRVRGGYIAEALAPLLDDFPVDVGKPDTSTLFLGQPVDYLHFDPEEGVTFIEVKSGDSTLSDRQRRLRDLVEAGAVYWESYRVADE